LQKLVHIEHSVRGQSGLLQPGRVSAAGRPMLIRTLFLAGLSLTVWIVRLQTSTGVVFCPTVIRVVALRYVSNHHSGSAP